MPITRSSIAARSLHNQLLKCTLYCCQTPTVHRTASLWKLVVGARAPGARCRPNRQMPAGRRAEGRHVTWPLINALPLIISPSSADLFARRRRSIDGEKSAPRRRPDSSEDRSSSRTAADDLVRRRTLCSRPPVIHGAGYCGPRPRIVRRRPPPWLHGSTSVCSPVHLGATPRLGFQLYRYSNSSWNCFKSSKTDLRKTNVGIFCLSAARWNAPKQKE